MEKDDRIAYLPESLKPIAESLGYAAAARLVEVFPGYRLHIPHKLPADHQLRNLGDELAEQLSRLYARETIEVPTRMLSVNGLARRIRELASQVPRLSLNEIAGLVGTTRRHVKRTLDSGPRLERPPPLRRGFDPRQLDLEAWLNDSHSSN